MRSASAAGAGHEELSRAKRPPWGLAGLPRAWDPLARRSEAPGIRRLFFESLANWSKKRVPRGSLGRIISVRNGSCAICSLWPRVGDQGCTILLRERGRGGDCGSFSLFRENLCSPGVLPELLLLGSLPRWGETGDPQRCPERYGRRGGDGGERLPEGSRARHELLGGPRGGTALSPSPWPRPGRGDHSRPPGHRAPAGTSGAEQSWTSGARSLPAKFGHRGASVPRMWASGQWPGSQAHPPGSGHLARGPTLPAGELLCSLKIWASAPRGPVCGWPRHWLLPRHLRVRSHERVGHGLPRLKTLCRRPETFWDGQRQTGWGLGCPRSAC